MNLSDLLTTPMTDADFLARQKEYHKARFEKQSAGILKKKGNEAYLRDVLKNSDNAMHNLFVLPGTGSKLFDVGTPPAWSECRVTDEEYLWSLNRMGYWKTLVIAYTLTGRTEFIEKAKGDLINWIDTCPIFPLPDPVTPECRRNYSGLTPWRSLEVGIRAFDTWPVLYFCLLEHDLMTPEEHTKITRSFYEHAVVLRRMSPIYWPRADHNHYLHEMLGLLTVACLFPDFKESPVWSEFAVQELGRCAKNQVAPEGGQVEGCPGYHTGCLHMFFATLALGREYGISFPDFFLDLCEKSSDYAAYATAPDGTWAAIGDTCNAVGIRGAVADYYNCYGKLGSIGRVMPLIDKVDSDAVPADAQEQAKADAKPLPGGDNYQISLDQYFARTGWAKDDSYFAFVCHTPVCNGHAHIDPMSFVLYLNGHATVIDPSYYTYQAGDDRKTFKSAAYHSTLTFDGKDPFEYTGMWSYSAQKPGHLGQPYRKEGVFAVDAEHKNYEPDEHRRLVVLDGKDVFFVLDDVKNVRGTNVDLYFHMDDPDVTVEGKEALGKRNGVRVLYNANLSADVLPGRKALHNDVAVPSSRLHLCDKSGAGDKLYLTLFTERTDVSDARAERAEDGVKVSYRIGETLRTFLWKFNDFLK